MEVKNVEQLQEFSEPLLKTLQKINIKSTQNGKKNNNSNNNIINSNVNERENPNLRGNASTHSILPIGEVTHGAIEVWAALPEKIRQDPSFSSFRQQHERIHGRIY